MFYIYITYFLAYSGERNDKLAWKCVCGINYCTSKQEIHERWQFFDDGLDKHEMAYLTHQIGGDRNIG